MTKGMKISLIVILSVLGIGVIGSVVTGVINRTQERTLVVTTNGQTEVLPYSGMMPYSRQGQFQSQFNVPNQQQFQQFRDQQQGQQDQEERQPQVVTPTLTVDEAKKAVNAYLAELNNADLELKEIMVFEANAYARVVEKSTGIGAFELLVYPGGRVVPEYGANMMWNLKYGHMSGRGMMSTDSSATLATPFSMALSAEDAAAKAQAYLDARTTGFTVDKNPDMFYGYYTIDILKDGKPAGMLSVNGTTGQIIVHTWHGSFVAVQEY